MTHRGCGKLPPRLAVCEPRACLLGGNEWVIHLEPQTECTGTSTGTNQQTKRKGHQPWHIAHRTKAITRPPISEGSCQNPDTRGDNSLVQIAQSFVQYFLRHMLCCLLSLQSADSTAVPACKLQRCRPKTGGNRPHLRFRSYADGLASLEHPSIPVATSGPAQSIPTLLDHRRKDPFFAAPYGEATSTGTLPETKIHSHTSAWSTTAWPRCPYSNQGLLAIYLGVRTDVTFASTHLQQQMALGAAHLLSMHISHAQYMQKQATRLDRLSHRLYCISRHPSQFSKLQSSRAVRHHLGNDYHHSGCFP